MKWNPIPFFKSRDLWLNGSSGALKATRLEVSNNRQVRILKEKEISFSQVCELCLSRPSKVV
jgi:hypothetical protein